MSEPGAPSQAKPDRGRAARLQQVFGDVLPEREPDEPAMSDSSDGDVALLRDVPPHHG